jgi:AraC-like DNA-binding protein
MRIGRFEYVTTAMPLRARLEIVLRGQIVFKIGRQSFALTRGRTIFVPAAIRVAELSSADAARLVVAVPPELALPAVAVERTVRAWAMSVIREFHARDAGWERIVEGLTIAGLGHLARAHHHASERPEWLDEVVGLAREQSSLAAIAATVGRHPSHVAREFRRHEGVSVGEYARRCRLELAARTLQTTERSIASIAVASGFCDQSHFTNAFRRVFGITPAAYRRKS